ncbi:MAG: hypothetical protein JNL60_13125 [Bacteroidia bacterium]|nr:hypothetical protein [Bacteroidia bacterium]
MKYYFLFILTFVSVITKAQDDEPRVIKVKKESNLAKVVLDNTEGKLVVVDRFGNPKENRILSYKLYVKGKKSTEEFQGHTNRLNQEMISHLNKQSQASKLFFTEISVEDDNGHIVKLPDLIETWFPDCKNCDRKSSRQR